MFERLPILFRSAMYALRGGFLVRPLAIALILGATGALLSSLEESTPRISAWIPNTLFPSHEDPAVAQVILSSIATSIMTVVSIVFAILLMTLTLASTQFSPRILISFVRDRTTQWTLGVFLGTFSYCMAALPAARAQPHPFVPVATVTGAMVLALVCVGWLIYFINHISRSISVNHIVDRIARETELIIEQIMPYPRGPFALPEKERDVPGKGRSSHSSIGGRATSAMSISVALLPSRKPTASACTSSAASGSSCLPALRSCACRRWNACRPTAPCISLPLSILAPRARCSRMSSSASSRSSTLRCARFLPRSTIPQRLSAAWISSAG